MNDLFAPCDFTNILGYPNFILDEAIEAIEELPSFLGNNVISTETHLTNFQLCVSKWCHDINHEDVKIKLFKFSLDGDALDWFIDLLANSFDSLESIIDAFEEKYGDKRKIKVKAQANENDKDLIKELTQMIEDMQLNQGQLIKAIEVNHSNQMTSIQNHLISIDIDHAQVIKNMELNQTRLIADHAKEMSTMEVNHSNQMVALQKRLLTMKEKQVQLINTISVYQSCQSPMIKYALTRFVKVSRSNFIISLGFKIKFGHWLLCLGHCCSLHLLMVFITHHGHCLLRGIISSFKCLGS